MQNKWQADKVPFSVGKPVLSESGLAMVLRKKSGPAVAGMVLMAMHKLKKVILDKGPNL